MRQSLDPVIVFRAIEAEPWKFDFFQALRLIECAHPDKPRLGHSVRAQDEPVRIAQHPSLSFAPATIHQLSLDAKLSPPRLIQQFFGMLGPNGPLPLHLTEFARDRLVNYRDPSFVRFLDLLLHRFALHFYRAWGQAQPAVSLDRPKEDRFSTYVGATLGMGMPTLRNRDGASDHIRLHFAGHLSRQVKTAEGLKSLLTGFFKLPVRIIEFAGHWLKLPDNDLSRLGDLSANAALGAGAVLGTRVWDRQHRIQIAIGPLSLEQYRALLPGGHALEKLLALVRHYLSFELDWDLRLSLESPEVPRARLGQLTQLGWTSWLGQHRTETNAEDLVLNVEQIVAHAAPT